MNQYELEDLIVKLREQNAILKEHVIMVCCSDCPDKDKCAGCGLYAILNKHL